MAYAEYLRWIMDKTIKIILEIQNAKSICFNRGFEILLYCTQLLSQHSEEAESEKYAYMF